MKSEEIPVEMIAPCGVNCFVCSAHLDRKKPCPGCRAPNEEITRKSCRTCIKKQCAFEQGLQWCFECSRFPCSHIKNLAKQYLQHYDVDLIKNGLDAKQNFDAFLRAQRERFTCKSCNGIIDQHRRRCSECGNPE